jgi:hypothetical protein
MTLGDYGRRIVIDLDFDQAVTVPISVADV